MSVTPNSYITPQSIGSVTGATFTSADTTVAKTVYTAGANGALIFGLIATTDDTTLIDLHLYLGTQLIGTARVAVGSGNSNGVVSVQLLTTTLIPGLKVDAAGNPYLMLPAGTLVKLACLSTMTALKTLYITPQAEEL